MAERRAVVEAIARHRGESGLLLDVRWPAICHTWGVKTQSVTCIATPVNGWLGQRTIVHRYRCTEPFFQPVEPGAYTLNLTSRGGRGRQDETELAVTIERDRPLLITCWPAKRRGITPRAPVSRWLAQVM